MDNPRPRFYVEMRRTSDESQIGSRWERQDDPTDPFGADESAQRRRFDALRLTGLGVRLVKVEWDPDGDEESMPITTVMVES